MGDMFSDKRLKALSRTMRIMFPARSRGEHAIRRKDKASVGNEETVVIEKSSPSVIDGVLNRNKLLIGTAVFYCVDYVDARDVRRIAEAGFDFLITECGAGFRDMVLRAGYEYGLGILSKDPSLPHADGIKDALTKTALFSDYADSPAHIGDNGHDEPNTSAFGYLGEYCKRYRQALPGKVLFYNLFPAGPSSKLLGAASYGEYIDRYVREVPTDYISVDVYPFFSFKPLRGIGLYLALKSYHTVAQACRNSGRDFWIYIQTQGNWFSLLYAMTTYEQIRWQAYAVLAYGAKCIMQVAYTPSWGDKAYAMKEPDGTMTEQFLYAKRVNKELNALSPVYMRYRSLGVRAINPRKNSSGMRRALAYQKKSSDAGGFFGLPDLCDVSAPKSALIGYFQENIGGAGAALMVVDCANIYSPGAAQTAQIALRTPRRVCVFRYGTLSYEENECLNISVSLGAGEGVFVTID